MSPNPTPPAGADDDHPAERLPASTPTDEKAERRAAGLAELPGERYVGPGSSKLRCFVAVNLPAPAVRKIAEEIAAIRPMIEAAGFKVRWVPPANLHLTLKFLGLIEESAVEGIRGRLRKEGVARAPFEVEARGIGAFPSAADPKILWAGIAPQPALIALQQDLERWMEALGFPREERRFHPHLTIGRVAETNKVPVAEGAPAPAMSEGRGTLVSMLKERESRVYGGGRVQEVVVYESKTLAKGAEYRALARIPIGK